MVANPNKLIVIIELISAEEAKFEEFNPWGRPGGGAPIRDRQGNMLNDYNTRKVEMLFLSYL